MFSTDLWYFVLQMKTCGFDDDIYQLLSAIEIVHPISNWVEGLDLSHVQIYHAMMAANEGNVRHRHSVIMRLQETLIPAIWSGQVGICVAFPPAFKTQCICNSVRVVILIRGPQISNDVNPLRACSASSSAQDRAMPRTMLQGSPKILEGKCTSSDNYSSFAPEIQAQDLVCVAVAVFAKEFVLVGICDVTTLADAAIDCKGHRLCNYLECPVCCQAFDMDSVGGIWIFLNLGDIFPASERSFSASRHCVNVPHDVMFWRVVFIWPGVKPFLSNQAVANL
mmetsp:Transcript_111273/g.203863  ORF Transcript_111273/g.203863 Transcript_111273/m.203863 type:complete len:280 (-) Transcript_111273:1484-2323(-)